MKFTSQLFAIIICMSLVTIGQAQDKLTAEQRYKLSQKTEVYSPVPPKVTAGYNNMPPSDAIVLFDGKNLDQHWVNSNGGGAPTWTVGEGRVTCKPGTGGLNTKQSFGDCQLHIEWRTPVDTAGQVGQQRGNSGVFLMGRYEVQVLDNYNNPTYTNGQAGSVYKQYVPLVNVCRPPGEWQSYDIIFKAPVFKDDGSLQSPAYVTVLHNGVLVQNHVEIKGPTVWIGTPPYEKHEAKLPIHLQDHGNHIAYRNIWIREL
ncbi:MAG: DUF1080 domain-containing protein [Bacteroidota bacterium]